MWPQKREASSSGILSNWDLLVWDRVKPYTSERYADQAARNPRSFQRPYAPWNFLGRERYCLSGVLNLYRLHPSVKRKVLFLGLKVQ